MEDSRFIDSKLAKWLIIVSVSVAFVLSFYFDNIKFTIGLICAGVIANYVVYFNLKKRKPANAKKMLLTVLVLLAFGVALYFVINALIPGI